MDRFLKQFVYGLIYSAVLAALIYGVYVLFIYARPASCFDGRQNQGERGVDCGGPCAPCGLKLAQDIATSTPQILEIDKNRVSVFAEIRNFNQDFGAEQFSYIINFYDFSGKQIKSISGSSFIYAGEIKNIVEPLVEAPFSAIKKSEILVDNTLWIPSEEFIKPEAEIREIKIEELNGTIAARGLLVNNSAFRLKQIGVSVFIFNKSGLRLGISKTALQDIDAFGQRVFSVTVPVSDKNIIDPRLTKIFVEAKK